MEKCPYCNGVSGYYQKMILYYTQYTLWDGTPENATDSSGDGGKRIYCTDCGRDVTKYFNKQLVKGEEK